MSVYFIARNGVGCNDGWWKVEGQELRFRRNTFSHLTDKRFGLRQLSSVIIEELLRDEGVGGGGHFNNPRSQDTRIPALQHPSLPASWRHKLPVANAGD